MCAVCNAVATTAPAPYTCTTFPSATCRAKVSTASCMPYEATTSPASHGAADAAYYMRYRVSRACQRRHATQHRRRRRRCRCCTTARRHDDDDGCVRCSTDVARETGPTVRIFPVAFVTPAKWCYFCRTTHRCKRFAGCRRLRARRIAPKATS